MLFVIVEFRDIKAQKKKGIAQQVHRALLKLLKTEELVLILTKKIIFHFFSECYMSLD
jgi:hypothetical protein